MQENDWELLMNVHLHGAYRCTAAAWPYFLAQRSGRIINTASAAGLYGNFGQSNYSAAKLALYGFTKTLAKEGAKKNIFCNVVAPVAGSRMTETVMPHELVEALSPEYIAPFVAFLCSDNCKENGSLFEIGGGFIAKVRYERSMGLLLNVDKHFNAKALLKSFSKIFDFSTKATYPDSMMETNWINLAEKSKQLPPNDVSNDDLGFKGKVVLITGAGAGLGRAYALEFAKEGATVIINDINRQACENVILEIEKNFNSTAYSCCYSVLDSDKIIAEIMERHGRIDVLVNNAGILRDKSFAKMTADEWKIIYQIHLLGTFKMTKAVWPIMLKQKYGRIINTCSAVGLYGNFGQANYAAAKAGILGFSNSIALEGKKHNILVNTIAPNAGTAMTATIMEEGMVKMLLPSYVAPLVVLLGSEKCPDSGKIIEVGSGWHAAVRWQRTHGVFFDKNSLRNIFKTGFDLIKAKWPLVIDFTSSPDYPTTVNDTLLKIMQEISNGSSIDLDKKEIFSYTARDVILYNAGISCNVNVNDEFKYMYENEDGFAPIPTFAVVPCLNLLMGTIDFNSYLDDFNPAFLLHGEHCLRINVPLPTQASIYSTAKIIQMTDKSPKGTLVKLQVNSYETQTNRLMFVNEAVLFMRKAKPKKNVPLKEQSIFLNQNETPDSFTHSSIANIPPDLASLYRLSGDVNPLHIDPTVAKAAGFPHPILHGMCSFGICAKELLKLFFNNDPALLCQIQGRFTKPVYPGQLLVIKAKRITSTIISFNAYSNGNELVISNGLCTSFNSKQKL